MSGCLDSSLEFFCRTTSKAGAVGGMYAGFALGVWTAVSYVQPAFDDMDGISSAGASGITAAIFIFGGIEAFIAAGMLAGSVAIPVVLEAGAAIRDFVSSIPCPKIGFFHRESSTSTPMRAQQSNIGDRKQQDVDLKGGTTGDDLNQLSQVSHI